MTVRRYLALLVTSLLVLAPAPARAASAYPLDLALDVPDGYVGDTVTATLTATSAEDGSPAAGWPVTFVVTWPDGTAEEPVTTTTDAAGTATHTYVLEQEGTYTLSAETTDPEGGSHGVAGTGEVGYDVVCRCQPPHLPARLTLLDAANGDDRAIVRGHEQAAGAEVRLFRVRDGVAKRVRTGRLDEAGDRRFRITDHNGRGRTVYYAVISATEVTLRERTRAVRVR